MEIGLFVKTERKRLGWTQQELADKSGVGLNFVYQLEKNKLRFRKIDLSSCERGLE